MLFWSRNGLSKYHVESCLKIVSISIVRVVSSEINLIKKYILLQMEVPVGCTAIVKKLNLPEAMKFLLLSHLPRLVAMVAKLFMCKRKVSNYIYYVLVILFLYIYFVNNHGKQPKMPKRDSCNRMVENCVIIPGGALVSALASWCFNHWLAIWLHDVSIIG